MADYSEKQIEEAWNTARTIDGLDARLWRLDPCDALIYRDCYGQETRYGWNIDHIIPKTMFGDGNGYDSTPQNRRAMHWQNNASKANEFPQYMCATTRKGNVNVPYREKRHINADTISKLLTKIRGLDKYIENHRTEWEEIYGAEQVQKFLSKQ